MNAKGTNFGQWTSCSIQQQQIPATGIPVNEWSQRSMQCVTHQHYVQLYTSWHVLRKKTNAVTSVHDDSLPAVFASLILSKGYTNWPLTWLWLTGKLSQSAPTYKHAFLDKKSEQGTWFCCFWKQLIAKHFQTVQIKPWVWTQGCSLLRLSKWVELSASWQEVNYSPVTRGKAQVLQCCEHIPGRLGLTPTFSVHRLPAWEFHWHWWASRRGREGR